MGTFFGYGCILGSQPDLIMKIFATFLLSLAAILAGAILVSRARPDATLIFASLFTAGLATWTSQQYARKFHPLTATQPVRLPIGPVRGEKPPPEQRAAA